MASRGRGRGGTRGRRRRQGISFTRILLCRIYSNQYLVARPDDVDQSSSSSEEEPLPEPVNATGITIPLDPSLAPSKLSHGAHDINAIFDRSGRNQPGGKQICTWCR